MTPRAFGRGHEWEPFEGVRLPEDRLRAFLERVPFAAAGGRRFQAARLPVPAASAPRPTRAASPMSTQEGFGKLLDQLAKDGGPLAERVVTTSPDVTVSTKSRPLGQPPRPVRPVADGRRVQGPRNVASMQKWGWTPRASISSSASPR